MQDTTFSYADLEDVALAMGLETAVLQAVREVESTGGDGFLEPGKPVILFEGHIFWKQLILKGLIPTEYARGNENILYPHWTGKFYRGAAYEYARLAQALRIHEDAALMSASWGMFQIMGFNYRLCGFTTISAFVTAMCKNTREQLAAFSSFLLATHLDVPLRKHDWADFACRYNGSAYRENLYDEKLLRAYHKFADLAVGG